MQSVKYETLLNISQKKKLSNLLDSTELDNFPLSRIFFDNITLLLV